MQDPDGSAVVDYSEPPRWGARKTTTRKATKDLYEIKAGSISNNSRIALEEYYQQRRSHTMDPEYTHQGEMLSDEDDSFGPAPPPPDYPPPPEDAAEQVAEAMPPSHVDTYGSYPRESSYDASYPDGDKFRDEYSDEGPIYENEAVGASHINTLAHDVESKGEDPPQEISHLHSEPEYDEDDVDFDMEEDQSVEIPPTTVVQRMVMQENVDKTDQHKNTAMIACLCCCFVVGALILIVGFSTDMFEKDSSGASAITTGNDVSPTPSPMSITQNDGRAERILSHLRGIAVDSSTFDNPNSPQYQAYNYLSAQDNSLLDPENGDLDKFHLTQKFALLAGLYFPSPLPWKSQRGWANNRDECNWHGVGCSEVTLEDGTTTTNAVTSINLVDNDLQGLSEEIGLLSYVTYLDLHTNAITGPVPASIVQLTALEELYLYENLMEGEWPSDLSALQNLTILFASDNEFEGTLQPFYTAVSLKRLILDNNLISGTLDGVSALQSIERLTLGGNQIGGEVVAELADCPNLSILWLFSNELTGTIPDEIGNMDSLIVFDVYNNGLGGGTGLPLVFLNNPNLQVLSLSDNPWGQIIPDEYGDFQGLFALSIENCGLVGGINENLANLDTLGVLRLARNNFDRSEFPDSILSMTQLVDLRMNRCNIEGDMPQSLVNFQNLHTLLLHDNYMSGSLLEDLADLPLKRLDLSNQFFAASVPGTWANLVNMTELILANNQLTGPLPDISNMQSLERLDLHGNDFEGNLDSGYLSNVGSLKYVDLSETQLSGELADDWDLMEELEELRLSEIGLTGDIPASLGAAPKLRVLDLSDNDFGNVIPDMFGGLSELAVLELSRNRLEGPIPASIGTCTKLQFFRVAENYLANQDLYGITGPLPVELGSLVNVRVFDCRGNQIDGSLPPEMGDMVNLEILDISSNLLSGVVPSTFENLQNLITFRLQGNDFTPDSWPNEICTIESLDSIVPDCSMQCPVSCCNNCS